MEDQKRLFIAIILSIVVILGWNSFFVGKQDVPSQKSVEKPENTAARIETHADSAVADYKPETTADKTAGPVKELQEPSLLKEPESYRTLSVSGPLYTVEFYENSGAISSFKLNNFRESSKADSPPKEMVSPKLNAEMFSMGLEEGSIPGFESAVFKSKTKSDRVNLTQDGQNITFSWTSPMGVVVEKIYTFSASTYLIGLDIVIKNGSAIPIRDSLKIEMPGIIDAKSSRYAFEGSTAFINGEFEEIKPKDFEEKDSYQGTIEWAGHADRYFISCIIPEKPVEAKLKLAFKDSLVTTGYVRPMERINPGKQAGYSFQCFIGPKSLKLLSGIGYNLKKAINFGWFDILAKPCLIGMNFIHDIIPNYGIAIIILTILIKLIFWPLGTKSYKSMSEMKKVQPLMMEIREKYKHDKQKMNAEVMALYKTYKVNPMGGCLPMIVQMPIFFALYRMLYQAIELRHAPFFGWIVDLSAPDRLFNFDVSVPMMEAPAGIPVLTIIMGASMFLQTKMSPSTGDPTQAKMMMLMPLFMTVIFINFPAGLVLYWLVNNIISIGQQYYIQKKFA